MRNNARIFGIGILLVCLTLSGALPLDAAHAAAAQSQAPTALALSTIPPKLPADNNTYPAVVLSVLDAAGRPTAALADINVSLTSSQGSVGKITASAVIPAGETYAIANFTTTHTAGVTTITATTTGFTTASTTVTTVIAVGYPTHLVITAVPDTVPAASANSTGNLILELEDDVGLPAKAITDIQMSLYSSNTNVVNVPAPTTVMKQGTYLEKIDYISGLVPGSAVITASASGFASGSATISVLGSPPLALKLLAQPTAIVACTANVTSCNGRLVVALTDLGGNPTKAASDINVQIRSSDLAFVNASETVTIKEGSISVNASYTVTATSVGSAGDQAVITASSPGLQSSFATVTVESPAFVSPAICTSGTTPCQLQILAGPNPVLADHRSYSSVVVSLLSGGLPAVNDTGPTEVTLTSSMTGVGNFTSIKFAIPEGRNWASVTFTSTYQVGTTVLTASAQNLLPVQTTLGTYGPVPSQVVVSAISTPLPADGASHPALELSLEDAFGAPAIAASDIPVNLSSSQAEIVRVASTVITGGETFTVVNVTAGILQGTANVTALVSLANLGLNSTAGYATSSVNLSTVIPAPSSLSATSPDADTLMFTPGAANQLPLFAVQLQDSGGNPARARAPMNVTITSSNSTVISKVLTVAIGVGQDYASIPLTPKVPGKTTLTLSAPGLSIALVQITFLAFPNVDTISGGPATILTSQNAVVSVNVALDGTPLAGAPVSWTASSGGLVLAPHSSANSSTTATSMAAATSSSVTSTKTTTAAAPATAQAANDTTDKSGASTAIFYPTKTGSVLITAVVSSGGLPTQTLNFTVQVNAPQASAAAATKAKGSLTQELTTFPMLLLPIGGAGGAVAAVFLIRKRRGGGESSEENFDTSFE